MTDLIRISLPACDKNLLWHPCSLLISLSLRKAMALVFELPHSTGIPKYFERTPELGMEKMPEMLMLEVLK